MFQKKSGAGQGRQILTAPADGLTALDVIEDHMFVEFRLPH
jgi:hypothetical protein